MADPSAWAEPWPYWKFGLKQNDLNTSLHDKYNTLSIPIQDPQAFHHDVNELSTKASSLEELERLLEERKLLRMKELNTLLEDASFEIIGNPRLIASDQWGLAIQLFRTRSFDSLVRYFASYLPSGYHSSCLGSDSGILDSASDATSPISPIDYDGPMLFDEPEQDDDIIIYTREASETFSACDTAIDIPTRSNTISSEDSGVSVNDRGLRKRRHRQLLTSTQQVLALSGPELEHVSATLADSIPALDDGEASLPSEDPETPSNSVSDVSAEDEQAPRKNGSGTTVVHEEGPHGHVPNLHFADLQSTDSLDSDTPTPRADTASAPATSFFDTKLSPLVTNGLTSSRSHPHHAHHNHQAHQPHRTHRQAARQLRRRESSSLDRGGRMEGPSTRPGRFREISPDHVRSRARARRRHLYN